MKNKYISMKAVAIILHSLQKNTNANYSFINSELKFNFWIHQAVSFFVVIMGFHYAMSMRKLENEFD